MYIYTYNDVVMYASIIIDQIKFSCFNILNLIYSIMITVIHVLYMYYTCIIHVLYMYYTCTIHVHCIIFPMLQCINCCMNYVCTLIYPVLV